LRFRAPTNVPRYNGETNPAYGLRTTGSHATSGERLTTSSSSRTFRFTSATPHAPGSSTYRGTRSTIGPTCVGSLSATFRAPTRASASNGSCAIASSNRGEVSAST
jgi:hypothetical protein